MSEKSLTKKELIEILEERDKRYKEKRKQAQLNFLSLIIIGISIFVALVGMRLVLFAIALLGLLPLILQEAVGVIIFVITGFGFLIYGLRIIVIEVENFGKVETK